MVSCAHGPDATKDKDMVTYNLALTILEQEVEHEEDLQGRLSVATTRRQSQ